ncbi:hypothetical protein TWF718_005290 [Orbilia javanica]|uniref:Uncharacterized protein n=1 Tax=Orbilia javanica TaxID=47235 RepID=A0AAN8MRT2_9PEZI
MDSRQVDMDAYREEVKKFMINPTTPPGAIARNPKYVRNPTTRGLDALNELDVQIEVAAKIGNLAVLKK